MDIAIFFQIKYGLFNKCVWYYNANNIDEEDEIEMYQSYNSVKI